MCEMTLPISDHPIRWQDPARPGSISQQGLLLVTGGAAASGNRVDALMSLDGGETQRRTEMSLGSVTSLSLLDSLLNLPLGCPIQIRDLTEREKRVLLAAPVGCVTYTGTTVRRDLRVPATVLAAVARGTQWKASLRRVASFSPFTQRIVVLQSPPNVAAVLEAQLAGVGIWVEHSGVFEEFLAPEPFTPKYFKAAGWRFAENAFQAALSEAGASRLHPDGEHSYS